jgi:hypothetical protein
MSDYITASKVDEHYARCTICKKEISIGNAGRSALLQHACSNAHKVKSGIFHKRYSQPTLSFSRVDSTNNNTNTRSEAETAPSTPSSLGSGTFTISVANDSSQLPERLSTQVAKGEVKLALAVIESGISYNGHTVASYQSC